MSSKKTTTLVKRVQSRFIQIDELCIDNLSLYAMSVYQHLRLLSDFSKAYDEIEITIPAIAKLSKMSERKVYDALNELEYDHFVIQRLNYHHFRYGKVNSYNVARDYNYFKPIAVETPNNVQPDQPLNTPAQNDIGVQSSTTPAPNAGTPAPNAVPPAQNDIPNNNRSLTEVSHKKQNKNPVIPPPVSVFSDKQTVKTHLNLVCANRNQFLEDESIEQIIFYCFETNKDKSFDSVNKRINIALKKVRENKWNIPQGWNGITSQSIREKEENHEKNKRAQYEQERQAMTAITQAVTEGKGFQGFAAMVKKLKDDVNGKEIDGGGVQKQAV